MDAPSESTARQMIGFVPWEFVNSLPDQFISRATSSEARGIDSDLRTLLKDAIREIDQKCSSQTTKARSFFRSARLLLQDLASAADELKQNSQ